MRDPAIFKIAIKLFRQGTPNRFFSYKVWKFEEVSHDMLVLRFPHGCLLGKLQYLSFVKVSEEVIVLFCVAGVVFRSIPTCFITCRKVVLCDKRNTFASFSEDDFNDDFHFVAGAALWRPPSSFCVARAALQTCLVTYFANRMVRAASSGGNVQIAWPSSDIMRVHVILRGRGSISCRSVACVECHFAWQAQYLGHSTLHTLQFTFRALHSTL